MFTVDFSRLQAGEEIIIVKQGDPVAKLAPCMPGPEILGAGNARGQMWMAPDFDAPLPDDILDALEGQSE